MGGSGHEVGEDLEEWSEDYIDQGDVHLISRADQTAQAESFVFAGSGESRRLDQVLADHFAALSRSLLQRWIADGRVSIDGKSANRPSQPVRSGQTVDIAVPEPEPSQAWQPEPIVLSIVYEDQDIVVVNKPAGLVVHPAAGHPGGTLANGLLFHAPQAAQVPRAGIVHRLDRETSGLMVVAKTVPAQISLVRQLQARTMKRTYLALAWGRPKAGVVSTWFGRSPRDRQKMAVLPQGRGKEAVTHVEVLETGSLFGQEASLIRCHLETGRTHQIRVHLEHIGSPLVGDKTYSRRSPHQNKLMEGKKIIEQSIPGQALHAHNLRFIHPQSGQAVEFSCDPPQGFFSLLALAGITRTGLIWSK